MFRPQHNVRYLILVLVFILYPKSKLSSRSFDVDSLSKELLKETNPRKRIELRNLIGEYGGIDRISYWDSIIIDAKKLNYLNGVVYSSFMQSIVFTKAGKYDNAVEYAEQALNYAKKDSDAVWMGYAIEHLGSLNSYILEKQTALNYYYEALKLYEKKKLLWRKGYVIIRLGEIYELDGNIKESMKMYKESLKCFNETKDTSGISTAYNKLGKLFKGMNKTDSALFYFQKALDCRKGFVDEYYLCNILNDLAFIHSDLGNKEKAFNYIMQSKQEADRIGEKGKALRDINYFLYKYYKNKGDYRASLSYKEISDSLDKVINNNSNDKAILRQQAKYIYEKEKELNAIENSRLIAIEREEKQKQRLILYGVGLVLLLVIAFLALIYNRFKITQKQKKLIELKEQEAQKQKHIILEKQKEILDSIYYARRIQRSLLTAEKYIDRKIRTLQNYKNNE